MPVPLLAQTGGLTPEIISQIEKQTTSLTEEMHVLQTKLHDKPETAWQEYYAHDVCTEYMEKTGWQVTRKAYGCDTAWEAVKEIGTGGPVIGFNSEYDALVHVGHACGHNQIAVAGISGAIATAKVLESYNIPAKIILLGTPAEEGGGGKVVLLSKGAYKPMEVCFMAHPGVRGWGGMAGPKTNCSLRFTVNYHGSATHAAASPEKGVNALSAAVIAYTNISHLRQHTANEERVYAIIKGSEGWTTNVIASESSVTIGIRTATASAASKLLVRAIDCLKAAGLASGCTYEIYREQFYLDMNGSEVLADYYKEVSDQWDDNYVVERDGPRHSASTDFGNVCYHLPALHPGFSLPDAKEGDGPHSNTFADWTGLKTSTVASMRASANMAALATRVVIDRQWAKQIREAWEKQMVELDGENVLKQYDQILKEYPPKAGSVLCEHAH